MLTGKYFDSSIRAAYFEGLTIVAWNYQSDAEQYLPGSPIVAKAVMVIGGAKTDAEVEALKEELRQKIADAEQAQADAEVAKQEFVQKAEALDDVAKETTSQEIKQLILDEGIVNAHEYAEEINEIIGDWTV